MSKLQHAVGHEPGMKTGSFADSRFSGNKKLVVICITVLLLISVIGLAGYTLSRPKLPLEQQKAVTDANQQAVGFEKSDKMYDLTKLGVAVEYADGGKCKEAYAILDDIRANSKTWSAAKDTQYTERITTACSGKKSAVPAQKTD